ncbi:MAG: hypothetical protein M3P08_21110 [Thermoproteota archaeon]|nr:hypothetical protein [Thermoproteota archaeon]
MVREFHGYLIGNGTSEAYQSQTVKALNAYAKYLGAETAFSEISKKEQIVSFLDTKLKTSDADPDKKWITT